MERLKKISIVFLISFGTSQAQGVEILEALGKYHLAGGKPPKQVYFIVGTSMAFTVILELAQREKKDRSYLSDGVRISRSLKAFRRVVKLDRYEMTKLTPPLRRVPPLFIYLPDPTIGEKKLKFSRISLPHKARLR